MVLQLYYLVTLNGLSVDLNDKIGPLFQKKTRHFSRPSSNSNNSGTMSRNHLKFGVQRVPIGDPSHTKFQVNRKNGSRVIAV